MMRQAVFLLCGIGLGAGCQKPVDTSDAGGPPPPPALTFEESAPNLLFSFVDGAGSLRSAEKLLEIPAERRQNVMVVDLSKTADERQSDRYVYFADVSTPGPDGKFHATVTSRYHAPVMTSGAPAADSAAPADGEGKDIIVYSAVWCGFCKKTKAFLKQKGVPFTEKDVEKMAGAEQELQQKAKKAGVRVSGVPVTDFQGQLVMGFDQPRLESLIKKMAAPAQP